MADHCHWNAVTLLIFCRMGFIVEFGQWGDNFYEYVYQPNSGDTQTVLITTHQESPSDLSGPTIDDSMPSGKEKQAEKNCNFYAINKKSSITQSIHHSFCKCSEQVPLRTLLNSLNMPHWRDKVIRHHNPTFPESPAAAVALTITSTIGTRWL